MDDRTFLEYVAARGPALSRLAYLLTGNHSDADDLVQQSLAKAYARWSVINRLESPDAYVRRMMANQNVSWWRSRRRERLTEETPEVVVPDPAGDQATTDLIRGCVRSLPPKQRAAVVFRYYEDLDDAAIAAALNCSIATVRSQISRALATLRAHLNGAELPSNGGTA